MAAKSGGKQFLGKVINRHCRYPVGQKFCRNYSISLCYRDKHVFAFYAEIQDGRQKWWENDFCKESPVDSADTMWVKNFVEIAVSRSISEINTFFLFYAEIQDGPQKFSRFLGKVINRLCRYPACQKFRRNCPIFLRFRDKCVFAFYAEIQDGHQKWRENDFLEKSPG